MTENVTLKPRIASWLPGIALAVALLSLTPAIGAPARRLTFEERVAARRAIEEVYWRHRIWPAENPAPKPALSEVLPDARIRARVADDLRKSNALESFWHRPLGAAQIQAELNRMTAETRDPRMLSELFAALGNDPRLIAETLARPALADRLVRSWYATDGRFHGRLRKRAEPALAGCRSAACMRSLAGGEYRETTFRLETGLEPRSGMEPGSATKRGQSAVRLEAREWDKLLTRLSRSVGGEATSLTTFRPGALVETPDAFVVTAVLSQRGDQVTTATVSWPKVSFDAWWSSAGDRVTDEVDEGGSAYALSGLAAPLCVDDTWRPTSPRLPDPRTDHTAVWTGSEMIVWGGEAGLTMNTGGRYDPATDTWTPTSTGANVPAARRLHTAVWTGTEMIVWGGSAPSVSNTGGRYSPLTDSWLPTSIGANLPAPRSGHSAVWSGTEMIVWGGSGGGYMNSGARYTPATDSWVPTSTGAGLPAPRSGHTAVWTGSRMIVWGGVNTTTGFLNTGGVYDPALDSWTATSTGANVASARGDHTAVWTGSEMIVWGGDVAGVVVLNTGRRYNPATDTWALVSTGTNAPSARFNHSAVWTGTEMLVWGGDGGVPNLNTGARYHPASDTWAPISTGTGVPGARFGHTAVWTGSEMIVWGGTDGNASLDTGGRYDPATDTWVPTTTGTGVPSARSSYAAVWTGSEMILWGGYSEASGYLNTGGRYDPATDSWMATTTGLDVPDDRSDLVAVWTGRQAIFWGGYSPGNGYTNTGGLYDPSSDTWTPTPLGPGLPGGRGGSTAVWTGREMIVWGGYDANARLNTGGRLDPSAGTWTPTSVPANLPGRYAHSAVWTGTEMIVWGGYNGSSLNSGGRYDPALDTWTETSAVAPAPTARSGHTAVWDGSGMIVWGGLPMVNTGGRYDPATDNWTPTSTGPNVPSARSAQAAVWTGREMIIWGGFDGAYPVTGGRYDPATDAWTPTSTGENLPVGRVAHYPIWNGQEMIVWGDANGEDLRSGAAYCACPGGLLYYRDQDGDGYGDPVFAWPSCDGTMPEGYVGNAGDCDDTTASTHPGAEEQCNDIDDDCNGIDDDVTLRLQHSERSTVVAWSSVAGGGGYDIVRGNLLTLNATGGDFTAAVDACLANDTDLTSLDDPDDPLMGEAVFYLVRTSACRSTWNSGSPAQQGDRDPEIAASPAACP